MKKLEAKQVFGIMGGDSCSTANKFQNYMFINDGDWKSHTVRICVPTTTCKDKHGKTTSITYHRNQTLPDSNCY